MAVKTEPYDIGDEVVIYADFENTAGQPTTPTAGTFHLEDPAGTEIAPIALTALANPSVGRLEHTLLITKDGSYHFAFRSTGVVKVAREGSFQVRVSHFAA